jgi:RimJ/RimL family protein N-acetyltransferase
MTILETERVTLRCFDESDAAFVLELLNDPAWLANIGDRNVRTLEEARTWIEQKLVASYRQNAFGLWAMQRRDDDALLGMCGLLQRDALPELDVGYALAPAFRGLGYAREAVQGCLAYARSHLGRRRVFALVAPHNQPSIRLLQAVGMLKLRERYFEDETEVFAWSAGETE